MANEPGLINLNKMMKFPTNSEKYKHAS